MTPRDLATWVLYSPRRLVAVAAVVLVGVALPLTFGLRGADQRPVSTQPTDHSRHPSTGPTGGTPPDDTEQSADSSGARKVTRRFLDLYLGQAGHRPAEVPAALRTVTTPSLWSGLRLADPGELPRGRVKSLSVTSGGAYAVEFTAHLSSRRALVLDVVTADRGWRVSDVRPVGAQ